MSHVKLRKKIKKLKARIAWLESAVDGLQSAVYRPSHEEIQRARASAAQMAKDLQHHETRRRLGLGSDGDWS